MTKNGARAGLLLIAVTAWAGPATAQENLKSKLDAARQQGASVRAISPIFSQLLLLSFPKGFKTVTESTQGSGYIRESVLEGETADKWSQMITVTGAKGLAANPNVTPQAFVERIATGFKQACPATFAAKALGAFKISGRDAFAAVASCGAAGAGANQNTEAALVIAIKGSADYYSIQWAERGPASSKPIAPDDARWGDRFKQLSPIKLCPLVPGEAAPYPSCVEQK